MPIQREDFQRFLNEAMLDLVGASEKGIKARLFTVIDDFCEDSRSWQEVLTVNVLAGTQSQPNTVYDLFPQQDGQIIYLIGVWDQNMVPQPAFMPTVDQRASAVGQLNLVNYVNVNQPMTVTVAKTIDVTTDKDMPIFSGTLFKRFRRTLLHGLTGLMMGEPNKSYSNQTLSLYHLRKFETGKAMARTVSNRQNTVGAQTWSFPQTFRTRGQRGGVFVANPTEF